ncbi:MAG: hypothetical protein ACFCUM_16405, partial [Bacteroidales bacterium]
LFYNHPHPVHQSPSTTPAHCGTRTQTRTAARHPLGFLQAGRFGSIFFTSLHSRAGGVGKSKGKGKLNTLKDLNNNVNLPLLLLADGWAKAEKSVKKILADFLVWDGILPLQKLVHPGGCVLLQWQNGGSTQKM